MAERHATCTELYPVRCPFKHVLWRRLATAALGSVAIATLLYLVTANILLRSGLLRNAISGSHLHFALSGRSTALRLDYRSAYSLMPGRVHVEGLSIRGRERDLEWFVSLDRADVDVSFMPLLHRTFHATGVQASGLSVRARLRLTHANATSDLVAELPTIPGFADPPLLDDEGPAPPPLTDAAYNLWTIDLEDVDVEHVREVWIHTGRAEGDTRVRGRWLFHPQRRLDVGPAIVDADGVDFSYANHLLLSGLHGSIRATVHDFDIRRMKGLAIFDTISFKGELHGAAIVANAGRLLAPQSGVSFDRCEGPFEARLFVTRGSIGDGTRVETEATDCEVDTAGLALQGPLRTEVAVDGGAVTASARIADLRVSRAGVDQAHVGSIVAQLTSHNLDLKRVFDDARFVVDVGGVDTNDVAQWTRFVPSAFVLRSGIAKADVHAEGSLADRRGRAELRLTARRLSVEHGKDRFTADILCNAQLTDVSLPGGWAVGSAIIEADDVGARLGLAVVAGASVVRVDLRRGEWSGPKLDLSGSSATFRSVTARSIRNGSVLLIVPLLTASGQQLMIAPSGVDGRVSLDLPGAELPDLRHLGELLPLPSGFAIEGGTGRARLHAEVELGSGSARGRGEVVAHGLRGRAGMTEVFGDFVLTIHARHYGGAQGSTDLSGSTLAISNAGTGSATLPEYPWWGNVVFRKATLTMKGGAAIDLKAHIAAKDASPATVLVSQNAGVPSWATNVFQMPVLDADAEMRASPSSIEVRSLTARGGRISLRAEYTKRDGHQDGAVLIDLGWMGLGYDLTDGANGLVLADPKGWFARKVRTMRGAASASTHDAEADRVELRLAR